MHDSHGRDARATTLEGPWATQSRSPRVDIRPVEVLRAELLLQNGRFEGPPRKWHENGVLAERIEFINGQPAGVSLAYFPSGFLKARARLEAGKVVEEQFWKDGEADKGSSP